MKNYSFTAIDFETANHKRSSACAIGLVRVEKGIITEKYYSLIKPEPCEFHPYNVSIHGITEKAVIDAPTFEEVFKHIHHWIKDQVVVAHNVAFEESVINALYKQYGISCYPENYVCTLYHSKIKYHQLSKHKLPIIYEYLFNEKIKHHDPLEDAYACAKIELAILNDWQPPSIAGMADALYENGSNFITNKKRAKVFKVTSIVQEEDFEGISLLRGNSFVFTGSPLPYSKEEAAQLVVNLGGTITSTVTKKTTHLVSGKLPKGYEDSHVSGKMKKAIAANEKGKNIQIVDTALFKKLIDIWMTKLANLTLR